MPMFVTHRKGLPLDGANPTLLYGYGAAQAPERPAAHPPRRKAPAASISARQACRAARMLDPHPATPRAISPSRRPRPVCPVGG